MAFFNPFKSNFVRIAENTTKYYLELTRNYSNRFDDKVALLTTAGVLVKANNGIFSARQIMKHLKANSRAFNLKETQIPGIRTIQNIVKDNPKKIEKQRDNSLDKPWHVATLAQYEYDIPPQALPKVLEIFIDKLKSEGVHLTIREAKWIARLSFALKDTEQLYMYALEYAFAEQVVHFQGGDVFEFTDDMGLYSDVTGKWLNGDDIKKVKLHRQREMRKAKEVQNER